MFVGPFEHHSNLLPWREIATRVIRIAETDDGLVDAKHLETELKVSCVTQNDLPGKNDRCWWKGQVVNDILGLNNVYEIVYWDKVDAQLILEKIELLNEILKAHVACLILF